MPVIRGAGFPPDHPFAGTRIVFIDAQVKKRVAELRAARDPMQGAIDLIEEGLRVLTSHPANDGGDEP